MYKTIIIKFDSKKLNNPNLEMINKLPEEIEKYTNNEVLDNGYDYLSNTEIAIFLKNKNSDDYKRIIDLLKSKKFYDNDLSKRVEIYISDLENCEIEKCKKVYSVNNDENNVKESNINTKIKNQNKNFRNNKLNIILLVIVIIVTILIIDVFSKPTTNKGGIKSAETRRKESIEQLKKENISYINKLPLIETSDKITLRSKKEILSRAIASYAISNIAIDYNWHKEDFEESRNVFGNIIKKYGIENDLTENERVMLYGEPSDEVALKAEWTIESSKTLFWLLGFIKNLNYPSSNNMTDANEINSFLLKYNSFDELLDDASLKKSEEILDYTDLYYRYHWACVEKTINDNTSTGNLLSDIVYERRRAFEWTINSKEDWDNFNAST